MPKGRPSPDICVYFLSMHMHSLMMQMCFDRMHVNLLEKYMNFYPLMLRFVSKYYYIFRPRRGVLTRGRIKKAVTATYWRYDCFILIFSKKNCKKIFVMTISFVL